MATPTTLPSTFVAGNVLTAAEMNGLRGAFRILQVVSTTKTDTFSTTSTSFTDVTGLSVAITPASSASKVLVMFDVDIVNSADSNNAFQIVRDSTAISVGDTAGNRTPATVANTIVATKRQHTSAIYLDLPATTSATTYKIQAMASGGTLYLNRSSGDVDAAGANSARTTSQITVMEVSA